MTRGGVDGAWPPRGGRALSLVGTRRGTSAGGRARRQARRGAGLGQGEARGAARGLLGQLRPGAENEAAAREMRKAFFNLFFQEIFKYQLSNIILSKKMTSFENVPKMKID